MATKHESFTGRTSDRWGVPLAVHRLGPTTSQILKTFAGISSYVLEVPVGKLEEYRDELKPVHREVLALLGIEEERFWKGKSRAETPRQTSFPNCGI